MAKHSGKGREHSAASDTARHSAMGFNGELHETQGWQLLGNGRRAYNPILMRFHSPDPLSPFGRGGINAYAYCGNDPINRTDPTGRSWITALRAVVRFLRPVMRRRPVFFDGTSTGMLLDRTSTGMLMPSRNPDSRAPIHVGSGRIYRPDMTDRYAHEPISAVNNWTRGELGDRRLHHEERYFSADAVVLPRRAPPIYDEAVGRFEMSALEPRPNLHPSAPPRYFEVDDGPLRSEALSASHRLFAHEQFAEPPPYYNNDLQLTPMGRPRRHRMSQGPRRYEPVHLPSYDESNQRQRALIAFAGAIRRDSRW